jgi:FkbM family methyltransferase
MQATLRSIAERLSRGISIRRTIAVSGKKIDIIVSPDAQLKYLKLGRNAFDADLISIAEKYTRSDSVIWDIGSNIGVFAFSSASIATRGAVIAVEADIWLASLLAKTKTLKSNRKLDVRILPAAVSATCGVSEFMIAKRGRAMNALVETGGRSNMGGERERTYVPTITLDSMLATFPAPNFVKIDIEGAELLAVKGASNLIQNIRPIFYIEIGLDVSAQIFDIFKNNNYTAMAPDGTILTDTCAPNTFFIPDMSNASLGH